MSWAVVVWPLDAMLPPPPPIAAAIADEAGEEEEVMPARPARWIGLSCAWRRVFTTSNGVTTMEVRSAPAVADIMRWALLSLGAGGSQSASEADVEVEEEEEEERCASPGVDVCGFVRMCPCSSCIGMAG